MPQKMPEDRCGAAGDSDAGDFVDPEALVAKRNQPENRACGDDDPKPKRSTVHSAVTFTLSRQIRAGCADQHAPNIAVQTACTGGRGTTLALQSSERMVNVR